MSTDPGTRLLRQTSIYLSGQVLRVIAAVAQVPLFAAYLAPAELGRLVTAQAVMALARTFAQLGLPGGMFRVLAEHHARGDEAAARRDVTSTLLATTVLSVGAAVVIAVGARLLEQWWLAPRWVPLADITALAVVLGLPRDLADLTLRATNRAGIAAVFSSATSVLTIAGWALAIVVFEAGALGMMQVTAAVSGAVSLAGLVVLAPFLRTDAFAWTALDRIGRIAVPTVPAALIDWAQQFADRFFIGAFVGLEGLGVYGLTQRAASALRDVVFTGIQSAWDPFTYTEHQRPDAAALYGRVTAYLAMVAMAAVVAASAGIGPLLDVIDDARVYAGAAPLVFFLAFAYWLSMLRHMLLAPTAVKERTDRALPVWIASGVSAIVLSALLIPTFEEHGAAWAKVGTYAVGVLVAIPVGRGLWPIDYQPRLFVAIVAGGVAAYAIAVTVPAGPPALALVVRPLLAVAVLAAALVAARGLGATERAWIARQVRALGAAR